MVPLGQVTDPLRLLLSELEQIKANFTLELITQDVEHGLLMIIAEGSYHIHVVQLVKEDLVLSIHVECLLTRSHQEYLLVMITLEEYWLRV